MHPSKSASASAGPASAVANPRAAPPGEPYGSRRGSILDSTRFAEAQVAISAWPGYRPTALASLPGLARELGLAALYYKDERERFELRSFKALGGAYAVARVLARGLGDAGHAGVRMGDLLEGRYVEQVRAHTVCCATDGNHGRSVAWGARLFGCACVIFVHETVSQGRRDAIAQFGAQVVEVRGNYDDAVRHAAAQAAEHGWTVVSDTSYPGYTEIPSDVMHGYGVMAAEIAAQMPGGRPPTHVFVQAGVGALAAAVCADFWIRWGSLRPAFIVVEPLNADCVLRSIASGKQSVVHGALDTVMAGLACGEVSDLAWQILGEGANAAIAIDDAYAIAAMRRFARPVESDPALVSGETGAAGLGALLAIREHPELARVVRLDSRSRVLVLGSEGDTDPDIYRSIVGRDAAEVLAG